MQTSGSFNRRDYENKRKANDLYWAEEQLVSIEEEINELEKP